MEGTHATPSGHDDTGLSSVTLTITCDRDSNPPAECHVASVVAVMSRMFIPMLNFGLCLYQKNHHSFSLSLFSNCCMLSFFSTTNKCIYVHFALLLLSFNVSCLKGIGYKIKLFCILPHFRLLLAPCVIDARATKSKYQHTDASPSRSLTRLENHGNNRSL